jgi:hypothetical protein
MCDPREERINGRKVGQQYPLDSSSEVRRLSFTSSNQKKVKQIWE